MKKLMLAMFVVTSCSSIIAEEVDLSVVNRIKDEAFRNSQVMETIFQLTDVNGPRLTQSPGYYRAANKTMDMLTEWGLTNARLEGWGEFGRGWELEQFNAELTSPTYQRLPGIPMAWTGSTPGTIKTGLIIAPLFEDKAAEMDNYDAEKLLQRVERYIETWRGKLAGKIVLMDWLRILPDNSDVPLLHRYTSDDLNDIYQDKRLSKKAQLEYPIRKLDVSSDRRQDLSKDRRNEILDYLPWQHYMEFSIYKNRIAIEKLNQFLVDEKVAAVFKSDGRGPGGVTFTENGGSYEKGAVVPPPMIKLPQEAFGRLYRLTDKGIPVEITLTVKTRFYEDDTEGKNVVAEIRGGKKADELVMLGGHLDSWHGGTGATDDGAGVAVAMEAVRILKALNLKLDRTVRIALWGGEEQGIFGSLGYVKNNFADPATMKLKPDHKKLSGYFNLDNGGGRIRGIYLQKNDMMRPIFNDWLEPFADLGVTTIAAENTHFTDHIAFDQVGLPGFQFIQDPMDYMSVTHHSDLDVADHLVEADLMQASAVMAAMVYFTANRKELLPREPLPDPVNEN